MLDARFYSNWKQYQQKQQYYLGQCFILFLNNNTNDAYMYLKSILHNSVAMFSMDSDGFEPMDEKLTAKVLYNCKV
jgi:hypothetical protein